MNSPEGKEMVPLLQKEIFESRTLKKKGFTDRENFEKEKYE